MIDPDFSSLKSWDNDPKSKQPEDDLEERKDNTDDGVKRLKLQVLCSEKSKSFVLCASIDLVIQAIVTIALAIVTWKMKEIIPQNRNSAPATRNLTEWSVLMTVIMSLQCLNSLYAIKTFKHEDYSKLGRIGLFQGVGVLLNFGVFFFYVLLVSTWGVFLALTILMDMIQILILFVLVLVLQKRKEKGIFEEMTETKQFKILSNDFTLWVKTNLIFSLICAVAVIGYSGPGAIKNKNNLLEFGIKIALTIFSLLLQVITSYSELQLLSQDDVKTLKMVLKAQKWLIIADIIVLYFITTLSVVGGVLVVPIIIHIHIITEGSKYASYQEKKIGKVA
jgi:hypothetical protein